MKLEGKVEVVGTVSYLVGYHEGEGKAAEALCKEFGLKIIENYQPGKYLKVEPTGQTRHGFVEHLRKNPKAVRYVEANVRYRASRTKTLPGRPSGEFLRNLREDRFTFLSSHLIACPSFSLQVFGLPTGMMIDNLVETFFPSWLHPGRIHSFPGERPMKRSPSRREVLGAAVLASGAALAARAEERSAQPSDSGDVQFGQPVATSTCSLDPGALSTNVSPDGHAITILFGDPMKGDLQIGLGGEGKGAGYQSAVKLVTMHVPVKAGTDKTRLIGYGQDIRGYIEKSKESRVVVIADCGGTTKVHEFPYGQEIAGQDYQISFFSPDTRYSGDPQDQPVSVYPITLSLLVQSRSPQEKVVAAIDTLDIEAQLVGAVMPPRPRPEDPFKDRRKGRKNANA